MDYEYLMFNAPSARTIDRAADLGCNWVIVHSMGNDRTHPGVEADEDLFPIYFEDYPKVLCDYWGNPIQYFRRPYFGSDPAQQNLQLNLGDVVALRPWEIAPGRETDGYADASSIVSGGDTTTTRDLVAAEFALLSPGADRSSNFAIRRDPDEFNQDNIVKVGR